MRKSAYRDEGLRGSGACGRKPHPLRERFLASYAREARISELRGSLLPCKDRVLELFEDLRELLFPGFFCCEDLSDDKLASYTDDLLEDIERGLQRQIEAAYRTSGLSEEATTAEAKRICGLFLTELPAIRTLLADDVEAAYAGDPAAASYREIVMAYPGIYAVSAYRIAHALYELEVPLLPRIITEQAHRRTGIDIHPGAKIGSPFFIDHGTGTVIGETTKIGSGVRLYQGVTLGALSTREGQRLSGVKRHPTIEDGVTIYAGATILGGGTVIGEGATIGGNVFLTESVEAGTTVTLQAPELSFRKS